jgi:hypothetical protein
MSNRSDNLRREADSENKAARKSKSLKEGGGHRRRGKALNDMADNEDWLDGKPKPKAKD